MEYNEKVQVEFRGKIKVLAAPLWIRTNLALEDGSTFAFQIPKGFKTDFASIPRPLWTFIAPSDEIILVAAIAHDYLYVKHFIDGFVFEDGRLGQRMKVHTDRLLADMILREKMKSFKAGFIKRNLVFMFVRLFGWMFYQKRLKKLFKKVKKYIYAK